jgi:hypothetical protein
MKKHEAVMAALFFSVPLLVVAGFAVLIVLATFTALTGQTMPPASVGQSV